jgi:hypothetical protein
MLIMYLIQRKRKSSVSRGDEPPPVQEADNGTEDTYKIYVAKSSLETGVGESEPIAELEGRETPVELPSRKFSDRER